MNSLRKCISLVLVLTMITLGLFFSESTVAASKPSTPEVTIKFVNATYPLPTTDPYTGQTSTILGGNYSIEVIIKNQATSDSNSQIYYNIRVKPHFDNNSWAELYGVWYYISENNGDGTFDYAYFISQYAPAQSTSKVTKIIIPLEETTVYGKTGTSYYIPTYYNYTSLVPEGGQVDFQVQALTGHATQRWVSRSPFTTTVGGYYEDAVAFDAASDWSSTQTITIAAGSNPSTTPDATTLTPLTTSPTSTPITPDSITLPWNMFIAIITILVVVILALSILAFRRRRAKYSQSTSP
jgi:hypothetical protein